MSKKTFCIFCFIILYFISGNFNCFGETTLQDVRNAVVSALIGDDTGSNSNIGQGSRSIVWYKACERTMSVPAGKSKDSGFRDIVIMTPDNDGWVVEIYGPFKEAEVQKIWAASGHGFYIEKTRRVNGEEKKFIEAERTLPGDHQGEFFGLILTCGTSCPKKILEDFLSFPFPEKK